MTISTLTDNHSNLLNKFTCVEPDHALQQFNSKIRKRAKIKTKEMDDFLKREALLEQNLFLNTTHLFIDEENDELMGFVSLCNDSLQLETSERNIFNINYETVPALKIARLATNVNHMNNGYGKLFIKFCVYKSLQIRQISGLKFITLDCYSHRESFYTKIGFERNTNQKVNQTSKSPISLRLNIDKYLETISTET